MTSAAQASLLRSQDKAKRLRSKKSIALGMLVFAAALFVVGSIFQARDPHWGWSLLIAMSEAAMIGGLADWFAVVALFRHPMGQRWIPHTAIIPGKKDQIGSSLANFISDHFLGTEQVLAKLRELKPAERFTAYLSNENATDRLGDLSLRVIPHAVKMLDSPQLHAFVQRTVIDRLGRFDVSTLAAQGLEIMTQDRRHEQLLTSILQYLHEKLESDELRLEISSRVGQSLWKVLKWANVDDIVADKVTDRIILSVRNLLGEMIEDPEHEMRHRIDHEMLQLVERLQSDPLTRERVSNFRDALLQNPALASYLQGLWSELLHWVERDASSDQSVIRDHVIRTAQALGANLRDDPMMRQWLDTQLERMVEPALDRYRDSIRNFIIERVERWPADELTDELELSIGTDLQYVRYNGTVVGALIGGILFGIMKLIESIS